MSEILPLTIIQHEGVDALFRHAMLYRQTAAGDGWHLEFLLASSSLGSDASEYLRFMVDLSAHEALPILACVAVSVEDVLRFLLSQSGPLAFAQMLPLASERGEEVMVWCRHYLALAHLLESRWLDQAGEERV